jgi:cytoskeletal protein CcmA (bactofilin family)
MFKKPSPDIAIKSLSNNQEPVKDDVETVVGPSVCVEGDFASEGRILVKGTVSGNVKTSKLLTVEEGAKILANVKAGEALVSGHVKGNVKVVGRLELTPTAQIAGDIMCKEFIVAGGALIHGKVVMKGIHIDDGKEKKRVMGKVKAREEK